MNPPPFSHGHDPLEARLRAERPEIADGGFTERVLAALPPSPLPSPRAWNLRATLLLGAALAGSLLLWLGLPTLRLWPSGAPGETLLFGGAALAAAIAAVGGAFFALVEEA